MTTPNYISDSSILESGKDREESRALQEYGYNLIGNQLKSIFLKGEQADFRYSGGTYNLFDALSKDLFGNCPDNQTEQFEKMIHSITAAGERATSLLTHTGLTPHSTMRQINTFLLYSYSEFSDLLNEYQTNYVRKKIFGTVERIAILARSAWLVGQGLSSLNFMVSSEELTQMQTDLFRRKNADYGNSFEQTMYEDGLIVAKIRMGDKLRRICSLMKSEAMVTSESVQDTYIDLSNYAIMTNMWIYNNQ